jgi:DNA recombination protein RmuC
VGVVVLIILQLRKPKDNTFLPAVQQTQNQLVQMQSALASMGGFLQARAAEETRTSEAISKLEMVISGTHSKGAAGENLVDVVFAQMPPEWQARNFSIGGKVVEFGLKLPNGLILPIDSKWPASKLIEQFVASSNVEERLKIKAEIDRVILQKVKEVRKYLDPALTTSFGIAVVPDSVFEISAAVQVEAFSLGVVVCSHSMLVPFLLLTMQSSLKNIRSVDLQKLEAHLQTVQGSVQAIQDELDGRYARCLTMLANSRDDMRAQISKATSSLNSLQLGVPQSPALPDQANQ